jgi:hypothetical protein
MEPLSRHKRAKRNQQQRDVAVLFNLEAEKKAGNKEAAKIYDRIMEIKMQINAFEFPKRGRKDSIDQLMINLLKEQGRFLMNLEVMRAKPLSYLKELKSKKQLHEN